MRISDWSSDVCSSDLVDAGRRARRGGEAQGVVTVSAAVFQDVGADRKLVDPRPVVAKAVGDGVVVLELGFAIVVLEARVVEVALALQPLFCRLGLQSLPHEIGRASWRERVCRYG